MSEGIPAAPQVWVDADACPGPVKEILFRAAERAQVQVTLIANQWLRTPPSRFIRAAALRAAADMVIDTSNLNVHQLSTRVVHAYGGPSSELRWVIESFGYKNGIPLDADIIMDVRFLPNPHWVPDLRPQTGLSRAVSEYVLSAAGAAEFLDQLETLLVTMTEGFVREGKRFVLLGIGCTGGKHRSTAISEAMANRLRERGVATQVIHRDLGLE